MTKSFCLQGKRMRRWREEEDDDEEIAIASDWIATDLLELGWNRFDCNRLDCSHVVESFFLQGRRGRRRMRWREEEEDDDKEE